MAISVDELVRELRGFDGRREIVKAIRQGLRKPVVAVRRAIKKRATDTLPSRNGLGAWVARTSVTSKVRVSSRSATIGIKGGRNSIGHRSDIDAIDRGRVRAPTWGHRLAGQWHNQVVPEGFFTGPASEATQWHDAVEAEVDRALEQLRR